MNNKVFENIHNTCFFFNPGIIPMLFTKHFRRALRDVPLQLYGRKFTWFLVYYTVVPH